MIHLNKIAGYFRFTRSEQRGVITLSILIVLTNILKFILSGNGAAAEFHPIQAGPVIMQVTDSSLFQDEKRIKTQDKPEANYRKHKIEINSADSSELTGLYGIGPAFASRIVKFRNLLGGFYKAGQLLEVYGMDSIRYSGFANDIKVDTTVIVKINLNTAGFRDLLRHPYLDYEEVKSIINFRDHKGPFSSPEQLWSDSVLDIKRKEGLHPYLRVN